MGTRHVTERRRAEAGSALIIATMVGVILTLLGLTYLALADQENAIALNQRDSDQLLFVAETGAKMVKQWFDRPVQGPKAGPLFLFLWQAPATGGYDLRRMWFYDRTQRLFDHDNDPNTAEVLADGTSGKPYFRQGMLAPQAGDPNYLSFWDKPYRGSAAAEFRGLETGPDIVVESNNTAVDLLDTINKDVVGNRAAQELVGRIQKIEVYGPPVIDVNGVRTRYGIATVKVTASKFRRMGMTGTVPVTTASSVEVGRRVVKMVLNETPYPGPTGPFQSCSDFKTSGNVEIHWGEVNASSLVYLGSNATAIQNSTPPSLPYASVNRYISGSVLSQWVTTNAGQTATGNIWFDPWFKIRGGGVLDGNSPSPQLYPYTGDANTAPAIEIVNDPKDETNIFQQSPPACPDFDYQIWKNVALSGGQNIHYMLYAGAADSWKEDGVGTAKSLQDWTHGQEGFWFFETMDRLPPDANGTNINHTSSLSGGSWASAGFIYLNAHWDSAGIGGGASRVIIPPGEPWVDADSDKVVDPGEFVNMKYPTSLAGVFRPYPPGDAANPAQTASVTTSNGVTYTYTTDPNNHDAQGLPFTDTISFQGVLYNSGRFQATGNLKVFGSVVSRGGMQVIVSGNPTAGTPLVLFDERLIRGDWPPPELQLPRTTITYWQTE